MTKEVISVSPVMAQEMLDGSKVAMQRPVDEKMVQEMLEDIENNGFDKDEANVVLDMDGTLFYGQHIIHAVIAYGDSVELNVYTMEENDVRVLGLINQGSKYKYHGERTPIL